MKFKNLLEKCHPESAIRRDEGSRSYPVGFFASCPSGRRALRMTLQGVWIPARAGMTTKKTGSESPAFSVVSGKNQTTVSLKNYCYCSKLKALVNSFAKNKQPRWTGRGSNPQFLSDSQVFCRLKLPAHAEAVFLLYQIIKNYEI